MLMRKQLAPKIIVLTLLVVGAIGNGQSVEAAEKKPMPPTSRPAPPSMTKEEMQAFLARPLVARLATVRTNGSPQIVPMWFLYEDGVMYMSTRTYAAKVKHLQKNPRVAVVVDEMVAPLKNKVVTLEGTVEMQTTGVKEMTTKIYHKYVGIEGAATPVAQQSINTPRVILKITSKKIESMDTTR
jgi:PPOX class probable F420-dependent enzyme